MSYAAIKVNELTKKYRLGENGASYKTFRESVSNIYKLKFLQRLKEFRRRQEFFWALKDISFEVKQGAAVGIIGHNGAGKSTLLKLLSRITEPTSGSIDIYGRVGSLLEVGTGFHQELTGRENIFLSGAILGMKNSDIKKRFCEIVEFAGVEKFIDTPIKHYSSGMHLRLAFAVAAHLEPDILLVDEVLAVGDMEFQKKCLNKMENVATEGRTVLFVSHNMGAIKELCDTAIVLKNGKIDFQGSVVQGIQHYSRNVLQVRPDSDSDFKGEGLMGIFIGAHREEDCRISNNEAFNITSDLRLENSLCSPVIHCFMEDAEGLQVVHNYIKLKDIGITEIKAGTHRIKALMPAIFLKPGVYTLYFKLMGELSNGTFVKHLSERVVVDVTDKTNIFSGKVYATILPPVEWSVSQINQPSLFAIS